MRQLTQLIGLVVLTLIATAAPAAADNADDDFAFLTFQQDDFYYELKITNGAGSNDRAPLSRPIIGRPAFSPDGTRIAFSGPITDGTDGRWAIYLVNVDGSGLEQLTDPPLGDFDPAWSANGNWIAFSRNTEGNMDRDTCCTIMRIRVTGKGEKRIPGTRSGISPAWDPSGSRLVYERQDGIHVTSLDGTTTLHLAGGDAGQPAWSPDGLRIAYVRSGGAGWEVVDEPADGGAVRVRETSNHRLESPVWDIDSETLFYVRYSGEGYEGRANTSIRRDDAKAPQTLFSDSKDIVMLAHAPRPDLTCDINGDGFSDVAIGAPDDDEPGPANAGAVNVLYGSPTRLESTGNQLWHQNSAGVIGLARVDDHFGAAVTCGDFDGDGFSDVAIGAPGHSDDSGEVSVLYGTPSGLSATGDQRWTADSPNVKGPMRAGDGFGSALTTGDFDGDGFDDLAIGVPGANSGRAGAGAVNVLYGSANGLNTAGNQRWKQDHPDIIGAAQPGDAFGSAVAAGDFDGNGRDDLAVGVPLENIAGIKDVGIINVIYGSGAGLRAAGNGMWHQRKTKIEGSAQAGDNFGSALAVGDFDGDDRDDLAVGVPFDNLSGASDAGAVNVLYGKNAGLVAAGNQLWSQASPGISGAAGAGEHFGEALTSGDFDGDGEDDLAVGVPGDNNTKGGVNVIMGAGSGLVAAGDRLWHRDSAGILGVARSGDRFGSAVTVGDFGGGGFMDLVIGVPFDRAGGKNEAGAVHVIYGSGIGLTANRDQVWHQNSAGILGATGVGDHFGAALR